MVVTQITGISKSRYQIYLDGEFAFILYKGELRQYQVREQQELSEDVYQHIVGEVLPKRAKLRCMNLLQSKDYTQKQLEDKLHQGKYPSSCIEEAISYVKSYGYVDDERYARSYIEYHIESRSRSRIEMDLMRRGIARETIRTTFEELGQMGVEQDELALVRDILHKKNYNPETATKQETQKMYGLLYRKGFRSNTITRALLLDIT